MPLTFDEGPEALGCDTERIACEVADGTAVLNRLADTRDVEVAEEVVTVGPIARSEGTVAQAHDLPVRHLTVIGC